jgi:hypothetical protein
MKRGRPKLTMTHRRRQVLDGYAKLAADGERFTLAALARRCGLYDYRHARRVVNDLRNMGLMAR